MFLGTYGEVKILPRALTETVSEENSLSIDDALNINRSYQSNGSLQATALRYLQNASKTVLSSTIKTLMETNLTSGDTQTNDVFETNKSRLNDNTTIHSGTSEKTETTLISSHLNYTTDYMGPTVCVNGTGVPVAPVPTNLSEIPAKEVIIVMLMLSLWFYSIYMTRKAYHRLLKE